MNPRRQALLALTLAVLAGFAVLAWRRADVADLPATPLAPEASGIGHAARVEPPGREAVPPRSIASNAAPITAPASVTLECTVLDAFGAAAPDRLRIEVHARDFDLDPLTSVPPAPLAESSPAAGRAVLRVPADCAVVVAVRDPMDRLPPRTRTVEKQPAGALVPLTIALERPWLGLRGRVLDGKGAPLVDTPLGVAVHCDTTRYLTARTDADGRFRVAIPDEPHATRVGRVTVAAHGLRPGELSGHRQDLAAGPRGQTTLGLPLTAAETELGELVLVEAPQLADGRVVDELGRGIAGVALRVETMGLADSGWRRLGALATESDAEGRFALADWLEEDWVRRAAYRLVVDAPCQVAESPLPFRIGERALTVVVRSCGALDAVVVLPRVGSSFEFECAVLEQPQALPNLRWHEHDTARHLELLVRGLEPGIVTLVLHYRGREFWRCAELEIRRGELTQDPRLRRVDLGELVLDAGR
ncbi:MAG: hypothetical protein IT457_08045 [Planctomycetes bacterium]|nr:hypothetical protein [Planctomycetota bacterium]